MKVDAQRLKLLLSYFEEFMPTNNYNDSKYVLKVSFANFFSFFWNAQLIVKLNFWIKSAFFNMLVINQLIIDSGQKDFTNIVTYIYLTSLNFLLLFNILKFWVIIFIRIFLLCVCCKHFRLGPWTWYMLEAGIKNRFRIGLSWKRRPGEKLAKSD